MLKDFFNSLSKLQTIVIAVLTLLIFVSFVPQIPAITRWFNSSTSEEYEPWNPENINVIKNNIDRLNNEAEDINFQLDVLPSFEKDIALNIKILNDTKLDTPYNTVAAKLQPNKIINPIETYYENSPDNAGSYVKKLNKSFSLQIDNKKQQYVREYINMIDALGFSTDYFYNRNDTYIFSPVNFYPKKSAFAPTMPVNKTDLTKGLTGVFPAMKDVNPLFLNSKSELKNILTALDTLLLKRITTLEARKKELPANQEKLKDDFNKKNFNINQYAVVIGIPFFIIAALLMYWYGLRSNKESNGVPGNVMNPKDKLAFALNTITVLILILSLLILGLAKVISENALAALLGTIGGYVLNNAKTKDAQTITTANGPAVGTTVINTDDNDTKN
ncbi:hypothetical protein GWR56_15575 [Mucilaginibacter sp. 14171R-50]|uniref:hypothetical protein n=1 Tax=Mucilaginibacter sp. 14171R-50 TaxID=2703789 RepID=UPI00138D462B|nr:hypothetical protein [Mucilaginibacter sp. 14171R-50]QHS56895.1 hypothetical protein GWR56_15575 [Mucilaginibacter sp. 14171R-50]